MKNKWLYLIICFIPLTITACSSYSTSAGTRVVVAGEDSNRNSVERTSEVYKAVIAEVRESLSRAGYDVIDEDLLAVEAGFRFSSRRPKTELIQTLKVANEDGNAKIKSRLAVIFSVFPQVKKLSFADRIESIRISGNIYDLSSLKALSTFQVTAKTKKVLPPDCDAFCISENVVAVVGDLAKDLGDTLTQKLAIATTSSVSTTSSTKANASTGAGLTQVLNLELVRFKFKAANSIKKKLAGSKGINRVEMNNSTGSKRDYNLETSLKMGVIEELIYESLDAAGINTDMVKVSISSEKIRVENLGK